MSIDKFTAKIRDVGGIGVVRLLPQGKRRTIGPWCFLDHAGSDELKFTDDSQGLQVGLHPHTNLQTFTWLLKGEVWHQDSLGFRQLIRPKQVNLMTAGTGHRGIAHIEQTPDGVQDLHAVQLWIALPMNQQIEPNFEHYPQLPEWSDNGIRYILTTGTYGGYSATTTQFSPLVGVDMQFERSGEFCIDQVQNFEYGFLVIKGKLMIDGTLYHQDELAVLSNCTNTDELTLWASAGTHVMLLGGEPLPHPIVIWWNFVADNTDTLRQAVEDWNNHHPRFGENIDLDGTRLQRLIAPNLPDGLIIA